MSVLSKWKNDNFALPLCSPLDMQSVLKSQLEGYTQCSHCLDPYCDAEALENGLPNLCASCAEMAFGWYGSAGGKVVSVSHDEVPNSCTFVDVLGLWELNTSAGTLTYNGTDVWTATSPWRCLSPNHLFNQNPPLYNEDPPLYLDKNICLSPTPTVADAIGSCTLALLEVTECATLPRFYTVDIPEFIKGPGNASCTTGQQVFKRNCENFADQSGGFPITAVVELLGGYSWDLLSSFIRPPDFYDHEVSHRCQNFGYACGWGGGAGFIQTGISGLGGLIQVNENCFRTGGIRVYLWVTTSHKYPPNPFNPNDPCINVAEKYGNMTAYASIGMSYPFALGLGTHSVGFYSGSFSCNNTLSLTRHPLPDGTSYYADIELCTPPDSLTFEPA